MKRRPVGRNTPVAAGVSGVRRWAAIRALPPLQMALLSVPIGIVAGLGAVIFRALIAFFHNLLFLGELSVAYDANVHTPASPWGVFVVLVPVLGAVGVAFLVKNLAPEARGHGVPEVMEAIYYNKGVIRPIVAVVKSLASALSIGSGGSIGREGPIIQIGSSLGSTIGQMLHLPPWQKITLIAAGAGGGIAATFNTPLGGVLFAIEIMLQEVSVRTLAPVVIATATATYMGRIFFGPHPSFIIPQFETSFFHLTSPVVLLTYVGLGHLTGIVSALFIRSIYGFEDFFEKRIRGGYYVRHMLGMLVVGAIMYVMMVGFGHYYVEGVGYSTIQDVLSGGQSTLYLLLLLFVLKLLTTSLPWARAHLVASFRHRCFWGQRWAVRRGCCSTSSFPLFRSALQLLPWPAWPAWWAGRQVRP
jgi:CIC family chloride channel protein